LKNTPSMYNEVFSSFPSPNIILHRPQTFLYLLYV
jgi:hypothetical protein